MKEKRNIGAIILAAGRGTRMNEKEMNKVALPVGGKPLIYYSASLLQKMKVHPVIVVIGHSKESVKNALKDLDVLFIEQKEQLGTGHAVKITTNKIPSATSDIIILYGDDSYLYNQEILNKIINKHIIGNAMLTFLTIKVTDAIGLGRIIRDAQGEVIDIIEDKDATADQRNIKEINPNCYVFKVDFLKKYLCKIPKSSVTGEYYLTSLIKIARKNKEKILAVNGGFLPWKGVNTKEDLDEAKSLCMNSKIKYQKSKTS